MNLTSIQEVPHGETPQNVPSLLLTERWQLCWDHNYLDE